MFELLVVLVAIRLDFTFLNSDDKQQFSLFVFFFTFLPGLCVSIRRLHDVGKSGWWLLLTLTGIGNIYYGKQGTMVQVAVTASGGGLTDNAGLIVYSTNDSASGFLIDAEL